MVALGMIARSAHVAAVRQLLARNPVVALLGARQVGKTTLARQIAGAADRSMFFDLERAADVARLADPELALDPARGLVVLDEIQRVPEIFSTLRVLADRAKRPARFLVLGSASPHLLRQTSETLAGRIAYHEVKPFSLRDVESGHLLRLWRRGGFPRAFLARSEGASNDWRRAFVSTFLERDIPSLGFRTPRGCRNHPVTGDPGHVEHHRSTQPALANTRDILEWRARTTVISRGLLPWQYRTHRNCQKIT